MPDAATMAMPSALEKEHVRDGAAFDDEPAVPEDLVEEVSVV